jgi:hypothetical protein
MGIRVPAGFTFVEDRAGLAAELLDAADAAAEDRESGIRHAGGPGGWHVKDEILAQHDEDNPPAAPADVTATADADSILVEWSAVPDAAGYEIYRAEASPVSTAGAPLASVVGTNITSFDDTTAEVDTAYFYVVVAVRATGTASEASDEATDTVES